MDVTPAEEDIANMVSEMMNGKQKPRALVRVGATLYKRLDQEGTATTADNNSTPPSGHDDLKQPNVGSADSSRNCATASGAAADAAADSCATQASPQGAVSENSPGADATAGQQGDKDSRHSATGQQADGASRNRLARIAESEGQLDDRRSFGAGPPLGRHQ